MARFLIFAVSFLKVCLAAPSNQYFSAATLHPNCLKVEPTPKLSTEWGMQLFAGAHFYIPFGSLEAITQISSLISSSPGDSSPFKSKACTLVRIKGFKLQMEGHEEHYLAQDCAVIKKGVNHCVVNSHSENPDFQKRGDGIFTIVWTDNETSMAIVRCTEDGLSNDWYVFSTQTTLNETVKASVISAVTKLGFPTPAESAVSPSYEGCQLFDPNEED